MEMGRGAPTGHEGESAGPTELAGFPLVGVWPNDFAFSPVSTSPKVRSRVCFPGIRRDTELAQTLRADRGRSRARGACGTLGRSRGASAHSSDLVFVRS